MATTYLSPGVYIEEIDRGPKPIQGVGTNVTAFIGFTEKAEEPDSEIVDTEKPYIRRSCLGKAVMITNWTQYQQHFGSLHEDAYLPSAVRGFFDEGGVRCYIVSIHAMKPLPGQKVIYASDQIKADNTIKKGQPTLFIQTKDTVASGSKVEVSISLTPTQSTAAAPPPPVQSAPPPTTPTEQGPENKTNEPAGPTKSNKPPVPPAAGGSGNPPLPETQPDFYVTVKIDGKDDQKDVGVSFKDLPLWGTEGSARSGQEPFNKVKVWKLMKDTAPVADRTPNPALYKLETGYPRLYTELLKDSDKNLLSTKTDAETTATVFKENSFTLFQGNAAKRRGIEALEALDDLNLICVPDLMMARQKDWITDEQMVAVQKQVLAYCANSHYRFAILDAPKGKSPKDVYDWRQENFDSMHGALYYPWIKVMDPATNQMRYVPPCGHIAGIYARSDSQRGVHKAPANEQVNTAVGLEINVTRGEQDLLNPAGINCIRQFPGRGIRVWGARTLTSDPAWRYINVRRLFNYVEESIERSTQWIVFEPNDAFLWARVRRDITAFLRTVWLSGALFGATPQESFYVKCDGETNPRELLDLGQMVCEIGMAPVKPAEFVIFRFTQWAGPNAEG